MELSLYTRLYSSGLRTIETLCLIFIIRLRGLKARTRRNIVGAFVLHHIDSRWELLYIFLGRKWAQGEAPAPNPIPKRQTVADVRQVVEESLQSRRFRTCQSGADADEKDNICPALPFE